MNKQSLSLVKCKSVIYKLCKRRLAKGRLPEGEGTIMQQYLTKEQTYKDKYKGSLCKRDIRAVCARVVCVRAVCARAVRGTVEGVEYSE